jgi:bacterioferritin-associated ferredoxin
MDRNCIHQTTCGDCPERFLCRCLQVTEREVVAAITALDIRNLREVRQHTGAGDGCNGCHRRLRQLLDGHARAYSSSSAEPICSVK